MKAESESQQFSFQAEIKQLLHLLAHSLYQSREIALRELISNASDALDKMRRIALTEPARRDDVPLEIVIEGRKEARELAIRDNGVGMSREELVTNLGTIAHSGSREFLRNLSGDAKADLSLIGQFGVGFYAAFMIADRVQVRTRGFADAEGWEWESDGSGTFSIRSIESPPRGTEVVLHLKDDAEDFADDWKIKTAIRRYSGFIPHPIRVGGEVVNDQKPIWVEPRSQVTEEEYTKFFQHLTHRADETPPLAPPPGGRFADPVPGDPLLPAIQHRAARDRPPGAWTPTLRQASARAVGMSRAAARVSPVRLWAGGFRRSAAERLA